MNIGIIVYEAVNNVVPEYIRELLEPVSYDCYNLRSCEKDQLQLPKPQTEIFRKSFSYCGVKIWNSLPLNLKQSTSVASFKSNFKLHLMNTYINSANNA